MRVVPFVLFVVVQGCSRTPADAPPAEPTFARDIAPIVYRECASCHRPGEAAPFPLLTYADVKGRARQIAEVTESRFMPPWMPEPGHGEFVGERRLTATEIQTIARWVERGAPEGDAAALPPMPAFPDGWQLGAPDLTVAMPAPITAPAEGADVFRTIVVPLPLDRVRYVRAVEFRPGNPRAVHHAMVRLMRNAEPERGARVIESDSMLVEGDIASPDGHVIGWAPGYSPTEAPRGLAWRLEPGTAAAIELHLQATGKPERIQASVGLFFTDETPRQTPFGLQLGSYTIDIPPGEREYVVEDRYELPVDVDLYAIYPHAHYLGRDIRAFATLPDGTEHSLIWIRDWDFNWQSAYRYRTPLRLPRGTILRMRYTYDNSAANPRNPSSPPVRVRYGGQSANEMGNLWMQVVPAAGDMAALRETQGVQARAAKVLGITERSLWYRVKKLGLDPDKVREAFDEILVMLAEGIAHERGVPLQWSRENNVAWKVAMPGDQGRHGHGFAVPIALGMIAAEVDECVGVVGGLDLGAESCGLLGTGYALARWARPVPFRRAAPQRLGERRRAAAVAGPPLAGEAVIQRAGTRLDLISDVLGGRSMSR